MPSASGFWQSMQFTLALNVNLCERKGKGWDFFSGFNILPLTTEQSRNSHKQFHMERRDVQPKQVVRLISIGLNKSLGISGATTPLRKERCKANICPFVLSLEFQTGKQMVSLEALEATAPQSTVFPERLKRIPQAATQISLLLTDCKKTGTSHNLHCHLFSHPILLGQDYQVALV